MALNRASVLLLLTVFMAGSVQAGLITVDPGTGTTTTFTQTGYFPLIPFDDPSAGPIVLDGITVTASESVTYGDFGYGFSENGSWSGLPGNPPTQSFPCVGTDSDTNSLTFALDGLFGFVGGFLNYDVTPWTNRPPPTIEALAADMSILESYNIGVLAPISTPNGFNAGAFRGIQRAQADIAFLRIYGSFIVTHDLTRGPSAVPAPATLALFGLGLAGLGWSRRKKV